MKRLAHNLTTAASLMVLSLAAAAGVATDAKAGAELVRVETATVDYREPGEFLKDGNPENGPIHRIEMAHPIDIMVRQVTRGEFDGCVADGACKPLDGKLDPSLPAIGVSYDDAVAYAAWLSRTTGETWRLPTDREWALAAGSRFHDDAYAVTNDPSNPSKRWLAAYDIDTERAEAVDHAPRPAGSFGRNEHGLLDLSGNVWEWTSSCYTRHRSASASDEISKLENCGVRITEGAHRAYMSSFIRDPKAGACSVGIPPANLGLRLVRDDSGFLQKLGNWIGF